MLFRSPPREAGGIRFGTPALTSRGMKEAEMKQVGALITRVLRAIGDEAEHAKVRAEVLALTSRFPAPGIPVRP